MVCRRVMLAIGLALLTAGCLQPSLNPLFTPAESVFDERLIGVWKCRGSYQTETWSFKKQSDTSFSDDRGRQIAFAVLTIEARRDDGKTTVAGPLMSWIGQVGDAQFINFFPDVGSNASQQKRSSLSQADGFFRAHAFVGFTFGRMRIDGDRLRLGMLNDSWTVRATHEGRIALGQTRFQALGVHSDPKYDEMLLTASTADLKRFAISYADDNEAFGERIELIRQNPVPARPPAAPPPAFPRCYAG